VVCDVIDLEQLTRAMVRFRPDRVRHQLTDLPDDVSRLPERAAANNRIRREGTRNLIEAAGAVPLVAQSVVWTLPGDGGAAVAEHERACSTPGEWSSGTASSTALAPTSRRPHRRLLGSTSTTPPDVRCPGSPLPAVSSCWSTVEPG